MPQLAKRCRRFLNNLVITIFSFAAVAGCASLEPLNKEPSNSKSAQALERWQGRFNAIIEGNDAGNPSGIKRESLTGRFELTVAQSATNAAPTNTMLELSSPLGQLMARLTIGPNTARLETADRGDFSAPDMDSLTDRILGWRIPVQYLSAWLQGKKTEGSTLDAQGRLLNANNGGWKLTVDEHNAQGKPARLSMVNIIPDGSVSGINQVRLRLLLD